MIQSDPSNEHSKPKTRQTGWLWTGLLILVLALAAYFRFTGIFWGEYSYLHPDERFLVWVTADLKPGDSLGQYFNTAESGLNPHNVGHGFYVYGTFPVIATRYLAQAIFGQGGWQESLQTGRVFSAAMDLLTVLLVYFIGTRIFNRKVGVLAAAFSALAVLQIQQAHFYTVDSFAASFSTLALYFAVVLATLPPSENGVDGINKPGGKWLNSKTLAASAWFGLAVGLALASKVNTAPVAVLLPAAWLIRWFKFKPEQRSSLYTFILRDLLVGGAIAFLVFRVLQPYAFQGPGFFGLLPNQAWIRNLKDLAAQTSGDVDFPPALQWARRPVTFSLQNLVLWGLGLPLGILSWAGFLWLGWRILKGEWQKTALMWAWTAAYFIWQSLQGNPTMRYQLPIYPTLAICASWAVYALWQKGKSTREAFHLRRGRWLQAFSAALAAITLVGSAAWAYAFTRIYTRPVTRVEASHWIFANVPGSVNLRIQTAEGEFQQPLPYSPVQMLASGETIEIAFRSQHSGVLNQFFFSTISDRTFSEGLKTLTIVIRDPSAPESPAGYGVLIDTFNPDGGEGLRREALLDPGLLVEAGRTYIISLSVSEPGVNLELSGVTAIGILTSEGQVRDVLPAMREGIRANTTQEITFQAQKTGRLHSLDLYRVMDQSGNPEMKTLQARLYTTPVSLNPLASGAVSDVFSTGDDDPRGRRVNLGFTPAVDLVEGQIYTLRFDLVEGDGSLAIFSSAPANESSWDDGLPLRMDGYDPYGGIYEGEITFEMYWDDNQDKLQRFEEILDRADYIFISSNRQWGTTTRVPERYPLTTAYYRALLGCPAEQDILWCYRVAEPGMFSEELGFELVEVFQSDPNIGPFKINDQFAEEAFTVYDHPKVLIFQKSEAYDSASVRAFLESIDLSMVVHVVPGRATGRPANLMLPGEMLERQQSGGTWSQLFDFSDVQNRYPGLGLVLWYVVVLLLGWIVYPLLRIAMKGLSDRGYPLAKIAALVLLSWLVWIAGSSGISFSRLNITLIVLILLVGCAALANWQRDELREELRSRWRYYLLVEGIGLAFFVLFLAIRLGNPDLWHPNFGGEKPMDFAFLNATLKSTTFPPYNPWFSGSYINYYYYGFVLVAVPVKWLGIVPSIAYNIFLPALFSMLALGAFSAGWNLIQALKPSSADQASNPRVIEKLPLMGGLFAAIGVLILGNLGTMRMIWHGIMRLVAPGGSLEGANIFLRLSWTFQGLLQMFNGARLPFGTGDWYWIPSRAIQEGGAITEFPFFTFLYADPHAHLYALPITLLAFGWALSILFSRWDWRLDGKGKPWLIFAITFFFGAVVIGSLYPTNTWDMPTYLGLAMAAIVFSAARFADLPAGLLAGIPAWIRRLLVGLAAAGVLAVLCFIFYLPHFHWFAQGYREFTLWEGPFSPFWSYMTHWGLFLFIVISWLFWETRDWMASTPLASLNKLRRWRGWIYAAMIIYALAVILLTVRKITVGWLALTVAVWAAALLLRTRQPDGKRALEFMIGSAAVLTLAVEVVTLSGDIGRQNTVFKFYLQAWLLLAVSSAVCLILLMPAVLNAWKGGWRRVWLGFLVVLVGGALLFPLAATPAKIKDRMSADAPHSLDGMSYMLTSVYHDVGQELHLSEDYAAIRWMQDNVQGSPVIVEAVATEYRWGARYSIYTGLPTVLGWNWHQRQQRVTVSDESVWGRLADIEEFYNTLEKANAQKFLDKYNVSYIIVGQMERAYFSVDSLAKFEDWNGELWNEVFREGDTAVYQVVK